MLITKKLLEDLVKSFADLNPNSDMKGRYLGTRQQIAKRLEPTTRDLIGPPESDYENYKKGVRDSRVDRKRKSSLNKKFGLVGKAARKANPLSTILMLLDPAMQATDPRRMA